MTRTTTTTRCPGCGTTFDTRAEFLAHFLDAARHEHTPHFLHHEEAT